MQIGQTYKIPIEIQKAYLYEEDPNIRSKVRLVDGILISITPHLYVFEYKDRYKNIKRTSIRKADWYRKYKKWGNAD